MKKLALLFSVLLLSGLAFSASWSSVSIDLSSTEGTATFLKFFSEMNEDGEIDTKETALLLDLLSCHEEGISTVEECAQDKSTSPEEVVTASEFANEGESEVNEEDEVQEDDTSSDDQAGTEFTDLAEGSVEEVKSDRGWTVKATSRESDEADDVSSEISKDKIVVEAGSEESDSFCGKALVERELEEDRLVDLKVSFEAGNSGRLGLVVDGNRISSATVSPAENTLDLEERMDQGEKFSIVYESDESNCDSDEAWANLEVEGTPAEIDSVRLTGTELRPGEPVHFQAWMDNVLLSGENTINWSMDHLNSDFFGEVEKSDSEDVYAQDDIVQHKVIYETLYDADFHYGTYEVIATHEGTGQIKKSLNELTLVYPTYQ